MFQLSYFNTGMKNFLKINMLFLATCILFMTSCGDEEGEEDMMLVETDLGYFPLTLGSWWDYEQTTFLGTVNFRQTVTEETIDFNGNTYKKLEIVDLETQQVINNRYFRCDETECVEYGDSFILGDDYEYNFIRHNSPAGSTWVYEYTYGGNPNRYEFEILEKGASKIVDGETFTDVTIVKRVQTAIDPISGSWTENGEETAYYAKDIGLIQSDSFLETAFLLKDYEIK